jgi:dihydropteroate synthase
MLLRARQFEFIFPRPALLMGVVNVTPDSFSDGGQFATTETAVDHAWRLVEQGADVIDIGGESSRPGATPVSQAEELRRVIPVIAELARKVRLPLSIDTVKPAVAQAALEAGASIINDIGAGGDEDAMWRLAAQSGAGYVLMHIRGSPQTMQDNPTYQDVVAEVNEFFGDRLKRLAACGVNPEQVVLDVGIGFGKRPEHNLQLLRHLRRFGEWKRPLLLGASRKSFMGQLLGAKVTERLAASVACACWAVAGGVQIIRAHDVAATRQAVRMTEALGRFNCT